MHLHSPTVCFVLILGVASALRLESNVLEIESLGSEAKHYSRIFNQTLGRDVVENDNIYAMYKGWYKKFGADLEKVRQRSHTWKGTPQTGDLEMSMSYLRLRATKPDIVWECSPAHGYSSFWILSALKDNGMGHLHSFGLDKVNIVYGFMMDFPDLRKLWTYHQGDVFRTLETYDFNRDAQNDLPLPSYVYWDALHGYDFGYKYGSRILRKLTKHTYVSLHDIYRDGWSSSTKLEREEIMKKPLEPMPEGKGLLDALTSKPQAQLCRSFTASRNFHQSDGFHDKLLALHDKYVSPVGDSLASTLYFELNGPEC